MTIRAFWPLLGLAMIGGCAPPQPDADDTLRALAAADQFQARLQAELGQALQAGGPADAVGVCAEVAPGIAAHVSQDTGTTVRRISLRPRNPGAAVNGDLMRRLTELAAGPLDAAGRPTVTSWVERSTHYSMRAVVMRDEPCGACHGTNVADEARAAIAARYPADQATGFRAGELRGAILVSFPAGSSGSTGDGQ